MCTRGDCQNAVGQWVSFRTHWGSHRGIVEQVNHRGVLVRVPRQYAPTQLINTTDEDKLDVTLTAYGYGPYGGYGGYGRRRWGYPGYGAWGGGWWWWWLAFS